MSVQNLDATEPNAVLDRWTHAAGENNVIARPYFEDFKYSPDSLLADFCQQAQVDVTILTPPAPDDTVAHNSSLNAEGAQLLQALIPLFPAGLSFPGGNGQRSRLVDRILQITTGPSLRIPPETLAQANRRYADSTSELAARFGTDPIWQKWLSQPSPPTDTADPLTVARAAELMLALSLPEGPLDFSEPDWRRPKNRKLEKL